MNRTQLRELSSKAWAWLKEHKRVSLGLVCFLTGLILGFWTSL